MAFEPPTIGSRWLNKWTREPFVVLDQERVPFRGHDILTDVLIVRNELTEQEARWNITFFNEAFIPHPDDEEDGV